MSNDVSFKRAEYTAVLDRWATVRDVCAGQHRVVDRLPYINAHDKSPENEDRNRAYRERAVFKNATGHTRNGLLGLAFHKDPTLTVPKKLEYLQDNANGSGVSIYQHSQGTLEKVLEAGRHGLYVDYHQDDGIGGHSVILSYCAEDIINWRTGMVNGHSVLTLVVLRESPEIPDGFGYKTAEQYRELALEDDGFVCRVWRRSGPKGGGPLAVIEEFRPEGVTGRLKEIPFTFVGAQNNDPSIDESPLYDIAMINLGHYRNSADYEDSVFWCGQAQPWISGLDEQWRDWMEKNGVYVGSRAPMMLPSGGQFGYAQPLPNTLVKEAMADKNQMMIELGARMVVASLTAKTATESRGDQSASTSVLAGCVANVSEAYTRAIMWCCAYMGIADKKVAYQVNQEFVELTADPQMITALVGLWQQGGFAKADLRAYLRKLGLIAPERTDLQIDGELQEQGDGLGLDDEDNQMAANQAILDATIRHAVFLEKLKAGEVGKFAPFLKEIDRSIRDRLTQSDLSEYNVKRLEALLKEVDSLLLGILDRYSAQLNLDLVDIANYEAEFEATNLARSAPVGVSLDVVAPTAAAIRSAVLTNPLSVRGTGGGKLLKAFIKGWTGAERERVTGTIRQGFFEGQTNFQIIRNIRGTKAAGYKDGILATTNRNASTVVHTAIQHVSAQARMEVAKANTDIVEEIQMVATLDSKTSQQCRSMDKRKFPVDSGPRPPFHPNCRTTFILLTKLSAMFAKGATRASVGANGGQQVSADLDYYHWLQQQPAAFQDVAIGPVRAKLFREGGLTVERFAELQLDRNFSPLTLKQMKGLEPLAFERAGI